jgi:ACS family tartrate transporter-like MFS transporter
MEPGRPTASAIERTVVSKIAWRVLPLLVAGYFIAYLDRVNVGFAAITMNKDIGLTATAFGLIAGLFFVGYVIFEIPSNIILNHVGARLWLARIMITWGVISSATAFTWNTASLGVARFLLGLAEAGFFPGVVFYLMAWLPNEYRARFTGFLLSVAVISVTIGSPISGAIMSVGAAWGLKDWQWLFILEGAPAVIIGIAVLIWQPDAPEKVSWLNNDEKQWLARALANELQLKEAVRRYNIREVLGSRVMWMIGAAIFPTGAATYSLLVFLPQAVKGFGLGNFQTGIVSAIPFLITVFAMMWWSARSDRRLERPWHIFIPAMATVIGLVVVALSLSGPLSLAGITLAIWGLFASLTILFTLAPSYLTGVAAAAGTAMVTAVGNTGSFVGPYLVGWIKDYTGNHKASLFVMAALMLVTAVIGLMLKPPTDRKYAQRQDGKAAGLTAEMHTDM